MIPPPFNQPKQSKIRLRIARATPRNLPLNQDLKLKKALGGIYTLLHGGSLGAGS